MNANQNKNIEVEIQRPDCGTRLELTLMKNYFCAECNKEFSEDEIRERCGV